MSEMTAKELQAMSLENMATYTEQLRAKYVRKKDLPTNVSALTNDAKYQTEEQVVAAITAKVSSTYKAGGSVAFAELPELKEENLGLVVNVTEKFTSTADFVEGADTEHPAGTNVAVVKVGEDYKYDALAGFVDLSDYIKASEIEAITSSEVSALLADAPAPEGE